MIILDTNVVSEMMYEHCDASVTKWLDRQARHELCLTAVNLAEVLYGIAVIPDGRRKLNLELVFARLIDKIADGVLPFDEAAANAYSQLMAATRSKGIKVSEADGQIAAIAKVNGFAVATRDVRPFLAAGVKVINPWEGR